MKRSIFRVTATAMAILAPVTMSTLSVPAQAAPAQVQLVEADAQAATIKELTAEESKDKGNEGKRKWGNRLADFQQAGFRIREVEAYSASMDRNIPVIVIQPSTSVKGFGYNEAEKAKATDDSRKKGEHPSDVKFADQPDTLKNLPTVYFLNGADGGEGRANWMNQSDIVQYYAGNDNGNNGVKSDGIKANIVIPMEGAFSYYSDWENDATGTSIKGPQKWETFMTKELPQGIEKALGANDTRAIAGMSMSGTTTLNYAEHNPGFYSAVGSFSGCAATTTGLAPQFIDITLNRGGTSMQQMWGGQNSARARANDALINAEKLRDQPNIYVSNGSGLVGKHDVLTSPRVKGNLASAAQVAVEGGVIEAATNGCTHDLKAKTDKLGIKDNITYNFRNQGTHQWGYWVDDLRGFAPVLTKGIGTSAPVVTK